jgi:hypothetical protein
MSENRAARGDAREARDSHFCLRACSEEHHHNIYDTKGNIITVFSFLIRCIRGSSGKWNTLKASVTNVHQEAVIEESE